MLCVHCQANERKFGFILCNSCILKHQRNKHAVYDRLIGAIVGAIVVSIIFILRKL